MHGPQLLLADRQGALVQRFRFRVAPASMEVVSCLIEQAGGFRRGVRRLLNPGGTNERMRQQAFKRGPVGEIRARIRSFNGVDGTLHPVLPGLGEHVVALDRLDEAVDGE